VFALVAIVTSSLSARLKRTQHELAKEVVDASQREQRRLGQDLHDGLCQLLVGIKLLAENVKNKLAATAPMEAVEINEIENRLSEALAQADGISRGLYPVELDADDLKGELESLLKKLSSLYGIRCALIFDRPPLFVDPLMAAHVYRMAQEGVINAAKGGKAKNVQVRLTTRAANGVLEVADDGIGFDGHPQRQGMGLRILNYRAQILNGTLRYDPRPGGGTLMSCAWRINNESENKDSRR
jgi:signal transduction histidine kinase